jgi:hypothetical protein
MTIVMKIDLISGRLQAGRCHAGKRSDRSALGVTTGDSLAGGSTLKSATSSANARGAKTWAA